MITPNVTPILSPSSAITREGAVADCLQGRSLSGGGQPAPETFSWQVLELDATFPEGLRSHAATTDPDFPSQHAVKTARTLCYDVDRIVGAIVSFSDAEAFEGDLLIHWRSPNRGITLICPADSGREPKLYREEVSDGRVLSSDIMPNPRASDVAREIKWVWDQA